MCGPLAAVGIILVVFSPLVVRISRFEPFSLLPPSPSLPRVALKVVVVILATLVTYLLGLENEPYNVKVLGDIPVGLPPPSLPSFPNVS